MYDTTIAAKLLGQLKAFWGRISPHFSKPVARFIGDMIFIGDMMESGLHGVIAAEGARRVRQNTLIILDPSDVQKPYAKKMEYLAKVWDGSKGDVGGRRVPDRRGRAEGVGGLVIPPAR